MKFKINNRWNDDTLFECDLPAEVAVKSYGDQLGYAVQQAYKSGINLIDADRVERPECEAHRLHEAYQQCCVAGEKSTPPARTTHSKDNYLTDLKE